MGYVFKTSYSSSVCTFSLKFAIFRSGKEETFVHAPIAKIFSEKSSLKVFKTSGKGTKTCLHVISR